MICVGIDVAKNKHDCFILNSEGEVLADVFTIPNNAEGFDIDGKKLRHFQNNPDLITTHMSRFLTWVGKHSNEIVNAIRQHYHSQLYEGAFTELRLIDTATILVTCALVISTYTHNIGDMTDSQAGAFIDRCIQATATPFWRRRT